MARKLLIVTLLLLYSVCAFSKTAPLVQNGSQTDATLSNLVVNNASLNPAFVPLTTSYTGNVINTVISVSLTPSVTAIGATVIINGVSVVPGVASGPVILNYGITNIPVVVTAPDGLTTKIYNVQITKALPAQPVINYPSFDGATLGTPLSPLAPTNSGGPISGFGYGSVSTLAGDNTKGVVNGNATSAKFSSPLGMAYDLAGNLYVSDNDANLIRKIKPDGTTSTFAGNGGTGANNGNGVSASFNSPAGLAVDPVGNIFVADSHNFLIRKITPNGTVSTFAGNGTGTATDGSLTTSGFANPTGLVFDTQGNLYVTDGCLIRKITIATGIVSTIAGNGVYGFANATGTAASFSNLFGVTIDKSGNLYVCDPNNYRIRKITPGGVVTTFAGSGAATTTDGTGTAAAFHSPRFITTDALGDMYVTDDVTGVIRKVTTAAVVTSFCGGGRLWYLDGPKLLARFNKPYGIVSDGQGYLYVADQGNFLIRKVSLWGYAVIDQPLPMGIDLNCTTGVVSGTPMELAGDYNYHISAFNAGGGSTLIAWGIMVKSAVLPHISYGSTLQTYNVGVPINTLSADNTGGYVPKTVYGTVSTLAGGGAPGSQDGTGSAARFNGPNALTIGETGLYVSDSKNKMIRQVSFTDGKVTTLSKNINNGSIFNSPAAVITDETADLYVVDKGLNTITEFNFFGQQSLYAGISGTSGSVDGNNLAATFNGPSAIAYRPSSYFVVDQNNQKIRRITGANTITLAGTGSVGANNGAGNVATFNNPTGIALDNQANIYVTDAGNFLIRKITPSGTVSTFAGSGKSGTADGTGTTASFVNPMGISADAANNLYIADAGQNAIRKITQAGLVSTLAGTGSAGASNGVTTHASFNKPYAIAADAIGNIYVADYGNNQIRKIVLTGYTITPDLPAGLNFDMLTGNITGTPTAASPATAYTITAYNLMGASTSAVSIQVKGPLADAGLTGLSLSAGTLSPAFNTNTTYYTATEVNAVSTIKITPTVHITGATVKINGIAVASGSESAPIALNTGSNTINTVVTSADGTTTKTYGMTIGRATGPVVNLTGMTISAGNLSPSFSSATTAYTASVSNSVTGITITPATADPTAVIKINNTVVTSGSASANVALGVGDNIIKITVTAQDGVTTQTYTLTVTKAPSAVATLSKLTSNIGTLSPTFSSAITDYSISVNNSVTSISFVPTTTDPYFATIKVNGATASSGFFTAPFQLAVGSNIISMVVTAQDGKTTKTYTVTVNRAPSADADLGGLSLSSGVVNIFSPSFLNYPVFVANAVTTFNVTPVLADPTGSFTVNGIPVSNGSASPNFSLKVGVNVITIAITAQDGVTVKNYTVTVTRATVSNVNLSALTLSTGALSPSFSPLTTTYTATVANAATGINFTPTAADTSATIKVNDVVVKRGAASGNIALHVGSNSVVTIQLISKDGTESQTYTITVKRLPSSVATLNSLTTTEGLLDPAFQPSVIYYTLSLTNAISTISVKPLVTDTTASVTVNGTVVNYRSSSGNIPLSLGNNTIIIKVTAQDAVTTKSYVITAIRAKSSVATLSNLTSNIGALSPAFSSTTTGYSIAASNTVSSFTLTPTATDALATIKVNGHVVASSVQSAAMPLNVGSNVINIVVTAQDTLYKKTYAVTVVRASLPPTLTSYQPQQITAGTTVTITGLHFTGATQLLFNNVPAKSFKVTSDATISAVVPVTTSGLILISTPAGSALLPFTYNTVVLQVPTITSCSPLQITAGTLVTIKGTHFTGATQLRFNNQYAISFKVISDTIISAEVPITTSGLISLATPGGNASFPFTYTATDQQAPTITSFSPTTAKYGDHVTLTGTNLANAIAVSFGGRDGYIISKTATSIVAGVDSAASGDVSVYTSGGSASLGGFTYLVPPIVYSYTPAVITGSGTVTVTGAHFDGATEIIVGNTGLGNFKVVSSNTITFTVTNLNTQGPAQINVITPNGRGAATGFVALPKLPIRPQQSSISLAPGESISLITDRVPPYTVQWAKNGVDIAGATDTSFLARDTGFYTVRCIYNKYSTVSDGIKLTSPVATPTIVAIDRGVGDQGQVVNISGSNFVNVTSVSFGNTPAASYTVVSSSSIKAIVGGGASGKITVTTATGSATYSSFIFLPSPTIAAASSTTILTGKSVVLNASPDTSAYIYNWYKDGVIIDGATSASYTATQGGSYYVMTVYDGVYQQSSPITVTEVFSLPANNFNFTINSVTCRGSANGIIKIDALEKFDYTATITGDSLNKVYPFNTSTQITDLGPGAYNVCITVAGQPNFQQCFTATITQPQDLSVYTAVVKTSNQVIIGLSGASSYNINFNGQDYTTTQSQITLPLIKGNNDLTVTTDRLCQGVVQKIINYTQTVIAYPNPVQDVMNLDVGTFNIKSGVISICTTFGRIVYTRRFSNKSGLIPLDLTSLPSGDYIFKLSADNSDTVFKIIKK